MADGQHVSGVAVGVIAAGGLLVYCGVKGISIPAAARDLITGKSPASEAQTTAVTAGAITGGTASSGSAGSASGNAIVSDAEKYKGSGYIYGGPSAPGKWDCSSYASYVLGHDLGMSIPGGSWATVTSNGTQHGPGSGSYMLFGKGVPLASAQPGDILATVDHMGFVIGNGQMISAQDEALGVGIASYTSGFPGGTPVCRRVSS